MFRDIPDHRSDNKAIGKEYGFIHRPKQAPEKRNTTKGWYLLVDWINGTKTWEKLVKLKELYPMQVSKYTKVNDLLSYP